MNSLQGLWALVRLNLRRDRIKLPVWIASITGITYATVAAAVSVYAGSIREQQVYALTTAQSVVSRFFGGPIHGPEIGEIAMNEAFLFTAILAAFMSTLLIVRHTRQNEETGRAEMISSAVVGRQASLAAALIVLVAANVAVGCGVAVSFGVNDLDWGGSIATGAAVAGVGLVFGAVALIAAQITESARGANGIAGAVIGLAFVMRALGDGMGTLLPSKMGVESALPSWLMPLGWGQQMYPYSEQRWWLLSFFVVSFVILTVIAVVLNAKRDQGLGMLAVRPGPAHAPRSLLSPLGLAWRLQYGILRAWIAGVAIMGITIGLVAEEFKNIFASNPELLKAFGGSQARADLDTILFSGMYSFMAVALAAYVVQSLLRARAEEAAGRLEPILATHVSRGRWLLSHLTCSIGGVLLLTIVMGFTAAATYLVSTQGDWSTIWNLALAPLVHVPAVLVLAAITLLLFGVLPRLVVAGAWGIFFVCLVILQFGSLYDLPQWLLNVSPFAHVPLMPAESFELVPVIILAAIGIVTMGVGFGAFRRRDLTTS